MNEVKQKMWKWAFVWCGLMGVFAVAQSRVDDFDPVAFNGPSVVVGSRLGDGGWAAQWCGTMASGDGGATVSGCSKFYELSAPINRSRLDALSAAGANRWLRDFRFAVDAGAL